MYAFASPHAGYVYPRDRDPFMAYRVSKSDWAKGVEWAGTRTIPLGQGCGLGYTYPNPVVSGKRMYLFMRGPVLVPVLHVDEGRQDVDAAAHARARAALRRAATSAPTPSTTRRPTARS